MPKLSPCRFSIGLLFGLLLTACGDFSPEWQLDRLRILAISAEPATLRPGEKTKFSALVVDEPQNRPLTFLWMGCTPDPYGSNRSPCADPEILKNPALLVPTLLQETTPENMNIQYLGTALVSDDYHVPEELFSMFPEEHPQRKIGTTGMVLLMVIAEALPENHTYQDIALLVQRAQDKHVDSQMALFRIPVHERDEPPNQNPIISQLVVDELAYDKSALVFLEQDKEYRLRLIVPPESFEEYIEITSVSTTSKTEALFAFFFSTCGKLENESVNIETSIRTKLLTPNGKDIKPCPSSIQKLFAVLRDSRSGQAWHGQSFVICQKNGPTPHIRQATLSSPDTLSLEGDNLDALAELRLGTQFLWPLPAPQNGHMLVRMPAALEQGTYFLSYTDFSCRAQTYGGLSF
jgi:hypothetical protein